MVDVIPLPEGMCLDDDGAALVHLFQRPAGGAQVNVLVMQQPVLVQVIDKKFCPVIGIVKTEEDLQPDFVSLLFGVFISQTEALYPLLPGQLPGNGGVAVEEMVGDEDAGVTRFLVSPCHFDTGGGGAGTGFGGVHMGFVFVRHK